MRPKDGAMVRSVPIERPQPSQLDVDGRRLRDALDWFDFDRLAYDPIPVLRLDDELVVADGHTRTFLAQLGGAPSLEIREDPPDRGELNVPLYRDCVSWCRDESITAIGDLVGRVVSRETFEEQWVARCRASPHYEGG